MTALAHVTSADGDERLEPLSEAHLDWVVEQERELHAFPWTRGNFTDALSAGYVSSLFVRNGEPIAYAIMLLVLDEAHLLNIGVTKRMQSRGVARRFLWRLFETAGQRGATQVFLEVRPSNTAARRLYQAMGFLPVGRRARYYPTSGGGREDAIVMRLGL